MMGADGELSPLMGHTNDQRRAKQHGGSGRGIQCNRILIIATLALIVVVAVKFQYEIIQLTTEISQEEVKIDQLEKVIDSQAVVIQRFNQSVSNADVLKKLDLLETSLQQTQTELEGELNTFTENLESRLDQTMTTLDQTVKNAEAEIANQVNTVKKDFEQYMITTQAQFSMQNSFMIYQIAGTLVLLSCLISSWHMSSHLRNLREPAIQRKILAILWMSPIYAITSWFSLVFTSAEGYFAIVKDAYEAYTIYQFLSFCISVMGRGDRDLVVDILSKQTDHLSPPFRVFGLCCKAKPYENNKALADAILLQCQFFALQFVFFRPLTTIATVFLDKYHYFGPFGAESASDYRAPQMYIAMIQNLSIFIAFTGLLKFYHAVDKDLAWCRPFAKFLCIKGVVFMTFWQGMAITILAQTTDVGGADAEQWAKSAQNFLICLEMLIFSIAHFYCFPTEEWEPNYKADYAKAKFGDSMALGDFMADLKLILRSKTRRSTKKKKSKSESSEATIDEEDEEGRPDDRSEDVETEFTIGDDDDGSDDQDNESDGDDGSDEDGRNGSGDVGEAARSTDDIEEALSSAISNNINESDNTELHGAAARLLRGLSARNTTKNSATEKSLSGNSTEQLGGRPNMAESMEPSESSGLLSAHTGSSYTDEKKHFLRPSIFTTIANIASTDKDDKTDSKTTEGK